MGKLRCWGEIGGRGSQWQDIEYTQVAISDLNGCAIRERDHHVECWGSYDERREVTPDVAYKQITASHFFFCGIRADNDLVECWGIGSDRSMTANPNVAYKQI